MTRRQVFLAPRAEADLDRLTMWIAEQGAPLTAVAYSRRIRQSPSAVPATKPGLRVLGFERRVMIAIVVREARVEVERVFYGGQNWHKVLKLPDD